MLKVIVADDNVAIRLLLKKILKDKLGHEVFEAEDGLQALDIIQKENPDLLISDISMPFMSGIELISTIRNDPDFQNLAVVVLTGQKDRNTIEEILKLQVSSYLLKPIEYSKTLIALDKVFNEIETSSNVWKNAKLTGKKIIVVIDKEPDLNNKLLGKFGNDFQIYYFDNGKDGFSEISKIHPDFVILSEKLGIISETIIAEKIKNMDESKNTKVFLCVENTESVRDITLFDHIFLKNNSFEEISRLIS